MCNSLGTESSIQIPKCMYYMNHYILKPVTDKLFCYYQTSINYTEDELLTNLRENKDIFELKTFFELIKQLTIPMLLLYCLIFLGICTLIAIPCLLYSYICNRRYDDRNENEIDKKYGYTCKSVMAFIIIILLALTTAGTLQVSLEVDKHMRQYLSSTNRLIRNVQTNMDKFYNDMENFNVRINNSTKFMINSVEDTPREISLKIIDLNTSIELDNIVALINGMSNQMDALKIAGLFSNDKSYMVQEHLKNLKSNFSKIKNLTTSSDDYIIDLLSRYNVLNKDYKFPDINKIFYYINKGLISIPNIIDEINSLNTIYSKIYSHASGQISSTVKRMERLEQDFCDLFTKINTIYNKLYSTQKTKLENFRGTLKKIYRSLISYHIYKDVYGSTLIFMIPGIHSLVFVLLSMIAFIVSNRDWKIKAIALPSWKTIFDTYTCSVFTFQTANIFGILFLWAGIFFAAATYFVSLFLTVTCRPLQTGTIYTEYFDNKLLWNNKTWLDFKLEPWNHDFNLHDVLTKCSKNATIFNALDINKHWDVEELFVNANITIDIDYLTRTFENAINSIEVSNSRAIGFSRNNFQFAEEYVILTFTPEIIYDVEVMNGNNIKRELNNIKNNLQSDEIKKYLDNIFYNILYLDTESLEQINSLLFTIKEKLRNVQEKLHTVMNVKLKTSKIIKQNASSISRLQSIHTANEINKIMNQTKMDIINIVLNQMGNCSFLPEAIDKEMDMLCNVAPYILNATWLVYTINALLMIICIIINDNLWKHLIDIKASQRRWRKIVDSLSIKDRRFSRPSLQEGYIM